MSKEALLRAVHAVLDLPEKDPSKEL